MTAKKTELFNSRVSFLKLPVVWITIATVLAFAIIEFFIIYNNGHYISCHTAECYNTFISDFKFPLGVATLLIPILAIYAAQHRSEISVAQIEATESQNIFANYYKHLEEFKVLLEDQNIISEIENYRQLHLSLFIDVKSGNYEIQESTRGFIISNLLSVYSRLKEVEELSHNLLDSNEKQSIKKRKILSAFVLAYEPIKKLREHFKFTPKDLDTITTEGLSELVDKVHLYSYISGISHSVSNLMEVSKFCGEFKVPLIMVALSELEEENGLIHGIPTDRSYKLNLPQISNDGERRRVTKTFSINTTLKN
ncbi:hypothetical protein [Colwellia sp. RSH04]|uniref:hypothetical protein n=1 Tax=Colwellia sp. RSH04 TaxID=2305464 RepID=UPI000E58ABD6|nr:hypothetical protein [Colwellia sp. RSH04]RHW74972.1 hypothetical protein D1094_16230 [Colwellia sp. RSH04]